MQMFFKPLAMCTPLYFFVYTHLSVLATFASQTVQLVVEFILVELVLDIIKMLGGERGIQSSDG